MVSDESQQSAASKRRPSNMVVGVGEVRALPKRALTRETCAKFGYEIVKLDDGIWQVAQWRDSRGVVVAQKLRGVVQEEGKEPKKTFRVVGDASKMGLFGKHLWPSKGKRVVVTEGEIDAMSVAQAFGLKWPVVSIPNGAQSADKAIAADSEWLEGYEEVVILFDSDEPGQIAAQKCAEILTPGRVKIGKIPAPYKDASDMLVAGKADDLRVVVYNASPWRPDGIVNGADIWAKVQEQTKVGTPYPWPLLTRMTAGQHRSTLTVWAAGTGVGKSTVVSHVAYDLCVRRGETVGYIALEESIGRSAQRFLSQYLGKPTHLPGTATDEELRRAFDATLGPSNVYLYDHFGSSDPAHLLGKIRYLAVGCGCTTIFLDHISIVISGLGLEADERRSIDRVMTQLRTLVQETGITLHVVSHLRRGDGTPHEEGGKVSLNHLRGSQAIAQLADCVIGLERNQQSEEGDRASTTVIRVLKNRITGETGNADSLLYSRETGGLVLKDTKDAAAHFGPPF